MHRDLENVIRQALRDAESAGLDQLSRMQYAGRAVRRVRPDMNASEALDAVQLIYQEAQVPSCSTDADAVAARRNQGEDLGAVGHGARSVERAISSVASPSPRGEWEISRAPSMKVRRWLDLMRYFAALVIDKAPDVLFVVVTVTFVLFLLLMAT